jgi:hypothetical protein
MKVPDSVELVMYRSDPNDWEPGCTGSRQRATGHPTAAHLDQHLFIGFIVIIIMSESTMPPGVGRVPLVSRTLGLGLETKGSISGEIMAPVSLLDAGSSTALEFSTSARQILGLAHQKEVRFVATA